MIVGIDATSSDLSVALAEPDGTTIGESAWTSAQRQSAELLPRLLELLQQHDRTLRDVSAIAVGTGPGSFTGLRVALALAKGLAVGLGRPIVGEPSLPAWLEAEPDADAAVARAGAREAYVLPRDADAPLIADVEVVSARLWDRAVVAPDEVAAAFGLTRATSPRAASVLAQWAAARLTRDPAGDDVRKLEPIYLRAPRGLDGPVAGEVRWL